MEWIKSRYDRFLLLLAALALFAVSLVLVLRALSYPEQFVVTPPPPKAAIPTPDMSVIEAAEARLANPEKWTRDASKEGLLVTSRPYIEKDGQLIDPTEPGSPPLHPPVENIWLLDNSLPIQDPTVLQQDPDDDGFNTLEEWEAEPRTIPSDPKSHPEYPTKLYLTGIKENPFNLKFSAVTSKGVYQIDAINSREPTQFLSTGDTIKGSDFVIGELKEVLIPQPNGTELDKSELPITNDKGETYTLVLRELLNVGKDDAVMSYRWKGDETITRRIEQTFSLKPEETVQYQVKEITENQVKIARVSDGKEYLVKKP